MLLLLNERIFFFIYLWIVVIDTAVFINSPCDLIARLTGAARRQLLHHFRRPLTQARAALLLCVWVRKALLSLSFMSRVHFCRLFMFFFLSFSFLFLFSFFYNNYLFGLRRLLSNYNCTRCGMRYCSIKCNETHKETRCMKFTM